ncbi:MAG: aminotransferase class I/II-fold pyridoxal phosphate-dependent enzyme [Planctomycetaceae bacterium]|nr:aminotransferase class I/II-fold pyridoxal phosphate-dependent enzyme [Planctomycetales bacterium]MCB9927546.1 aminotransferase class I/II-fold pyridoxal phosphate-dependent enzyme [Planctomycetaceae bacterium]
MKPTQGLSAEANEIANAVFEQVRSIIPPDIEVDLTLESSLYEIGVDSLARMGVINRLEEAFVIRFPEDMLYDLETCGDLIECVQEILAKKTSRGAAPKKQVAAKPEPAEPAAPSDVRPEHYNVELFPECVAFDQRLTGAEAAGYSIPFFRVKERVKGSNAWVNGNEVISYTSFDYLGLAGSPRVTAAATRAIEQFGTSASASRLVGGDSTILAELDRELAAWIGTEAALVFPSGYGTNASVLAHLFGANDLILYDELAHNSIVHGTMTSEAQRRPFPHNDYAHVDKLLRDLRSQYRRVAVAVEGVYSMDGDYPDLAKFIDVKLRHKALLYVDEAHSIGVLGKTGRGICEHFGVDPNDGDLWMGTISKGLGSAGGYIAGRHKMIQYLKYTTPAFVFATAVPPSSSAASLEAIRCLRDEPERVETLRDRSALFVRLAKERGLNTGESQGTPVVPIIIGDSMRCIWLSHELLRNGIDAQPILYPAVPESLSRLRFFITSNHTPAQIEQTVDTLADCIAASQQ